MATKNKKTPAKKTAKKTTVKAKVTKKEEKPVVEVWLEESYYHYMSRGPMFVSAETHSELEGMSLEEMKDYILENQEDMGIIDELKEYDVVKDKFLDENEDIFFNN